MKGSWKTLAALVSVGLMLVLVAAAGASTKVSNGNFERGDLSDWSTDSTGGGAWDVYQGNETNTLGIPFYRPPQGTWAAAAEESVPSRNALYRTIGLGTGKTQQISFYVYYQNFCSDFVPEDQEYRIDIQPDGADPLSTDPADVLKNLFKTKPGDNLSKGPKLKTYKLKGLSGPVQLRFLVTASCEELNGGVDDVRLGSAS